MSVIIPHIVHFPIESVRSIMDNSPKTDERRHFSDIIIKDVYSSRKSHDSSHENVIKARDISDLDYSCIIHIDPPEIENRPEILKVNNEKERIIDRTAFMKQLQCDQRKLLHSSLGRRVMKEDHSMMKKSEPKKSLKMEDKYVSEKVQTEPVWILSIPIDHKVTFSPNGSEDDINGKNVEFHNLKTQANETQKQRTETKEDFEGPYKSSVRTVGQMEALNSIKGDIKKQDSSEELWGDIFNEFKEESEDISEINMFEKNKRRDLLRNNIIPTRTSYTGDCSRRTFQTYTSQISDPTKSSKSLAVNLKTQTKLNETGKDEVVYSERDLLQKFYEVAIFDEIAISYLSSTDRRVKSVCSKIGCRIRMYGPIIQWNTDENELQRPPSRIKTFYYLTIGAPSKERLEKAVKYVLETFSMTCLNERFNSLPLVGNLEKEIPL